MAREEGSSAAGVLFALGAYGLWGLSPVYWKWVAAVPAVELLAWRALWSFALAVVLGIFLGRLPEAGEVLRSPRRLMPLAISGALLGVNWFTFVWAVQNDRIVATSLGYYMSPLVHITLGVLVLSERLRRSQAIAISIATLGVAFMVFERGEVPWIAIVLPTTFGAYGLVRKLSPVRPLVGFGLEMLLMVPLAAACLVWLSATGRLTMDGAGVGLHAAVAASGLMTAAPLVWFVNAARRLPLTTLGMFQYVAPSIALGIGVGFYGEPFTRAHAVTFGCVWFALTLYSFDLLSLHVPWRGVKTPE
jgi:chloramphenicol-sensitive protein RarD